jgi:hypothetical protein
MTHSSSSRVITDALPFYFYSLLEWKRFWRLSEMRQILRIQWRYIPDTIWFFRALISVAVLSGGLISDGVAHTLPDLRVAAAIIVRSAASQSGITAVRQPRADQSSDLGPPDTSADVDYPAALVDFEPDNAPVRPDILEVQRPRMSGSWPADNAMRATALKPEAGGFHWGAAVGQSLFFLGVMHGLRLAFDPGSRADLRGPFLKDYFNTVKRLHGWRDGNGFVVNYIGHPLEGAASGYIQIQNDPKGTQEFSMGKAYWRSRLKAMGWAALLSTMFELGPISEASIGNVGLKPRRQAKNPMAWVDLVVTPTVGTAWLVGEDILDHYLVRRVENNSSSPLVRVLARTFFNPSRSMSNMLRLKYPWHRDNRALE